MSAEKIVPELLNWFETHARDLPWRRTRDPYAIWVSEIMLQQTQVGTVIPFWERWMQALPTIESLARATPAKIHKLWEGLGYYTRVRNLQKAARLIVQRHDGEFPKNFEQVLALPGIGPYTAGAICSIAFDQARPILDGNVIRVLTRVYGIQGDPREKAVNRQLWQLAEELVRAAAAQAPRPERHHLSPRLPDAKGRCCCFNQALMELGALVCAPRGPVCQECPLGKICVARKEGRTALLPELAQRPPATRRRFVACVAWRGNKVLVRQRPAGVVNAHLWEFPNIEVAASDGNPKKALLKMLGNVPADLKPLCRVDHSITRYRIRLDVFQTASTGACRRAQPAGQWLSRARLRRLAFTAAHKRVLLALDDVCERLGGQGA